MSGGLPVVFMRCFVEYYFKEGLPYDEKMQSQRSPIHRPQSPSVLSYSRAYRHGQPQLTLQMYCQI